MNFDVWLFCFFSLSSALLCVGTKVLDRAAQIERHSTHSYPKFPFYMCCLVICDLSLQRLSLSSCLCFIPSPPQAGPSLTVHQSGYPSKLLAGGRDFWVRPAWLFVCNSLLLPCLSLSLPPLSCHACTPLAMSCRSDSCWGRRGTVGILGLWFLYFFYCTFINLIPFFWTALCFLVFFLKLLLFASKQ